MPARTREILEDALRRIDQRRNEITGKSGKLKEIYHEIELLDEQIEELHAEARKLKKEEGHEEELLALKDEERRIKQYLLDEYGKLRSLNKPADTGS